MKYYIDFEATEEKQEIISVGCVREDGKEFYSLVHSDDPITLKIEEITGISQADIDEAPSAREAFEALADFCKQDEELPEFINYGDADADYVYNTFSNASSLKEAGMLSFLYLNMYDIADDVKQFFYVNKTISLEKLGKYFDKDMDDQNHNALDDAKLLKMVCDNMKNGKQDSNVFNEYLDPLRYPDIVSKVLRMQGSSIVNEFDSLEDAVAWVKAQPDDKGHKYVQNAAEKIKTAAKNGSRYFDSSWRII